MKFKIPRDFWHIGSRYTDPTAIAPRRLRVKTIPHRHHVAGKRKIRHRLDRPVTSPSPEPVPTAANIHYEAAAKARGIACGGISAIHLLARKLGLPQAIDERLHLLKLLLPYHESDHVLNLAYNALCNRTCLDDIELGRNGVVFLDALGSDRIPDGFDLGLMYASWLSRPHIMPLPGTHSSGRSCSRTATNAPSCTSGAARSTPPPHRPLSTSSPNRRAAA
jgi:hypothetical protein